MRTIAIVNQKGGCGKTTTAINVASALAEQGKHVLLVDLDSQSHSTLGLGYGPSILGKTIYEVINSQRMLISDVIIHTNIPRLDLVPSSILVSGLDLDLASQHAREYVLSQHLSCIKGSYDVCVIDCSPSLNLLTLNALVASTEVIIPVQAQYYAIEGLKQLFGTINIVKDRFNHKLKILGVLLTLVESTTTLSKNIQSQMRDYFGDLVFDTVIHRTVRLAEAPSAGQSILTYAPESKGAFEYTALAQEISNGR